MESKDETVPTPDPNDVPYKLTDLEYDWGIIGTGLTQSLFAASLAQIGQQKLLIFDSDTTYSSSLRTLNFQQLNNFLEKETQGPDVKETIKNNPFYSIPVSDKMKTLNSEFYDKMTKTSSQFKEYNIDLQPKFLYSRSLTVRMMQQANMDQYMDFKAVGGIYFYDRQKKQFLLSPTEKSDIFKHEDLSMVEQQSLFQMLHTCVQLFNIASGEIIDQNSTHEFDKDFEIDSETLELYEEFQNKNCLEFLDKQKAADQVKEIFLYTICGFDCDPSQVVSYNYDVQQQYTTTQFISRMSMYIKSCGVHSKLPFLYANYGTGDIPQSYSRIAAVHGSTYCIDQRIKFSDGEVGVIKSETPAEEQGSLVSQTTENDSQVLHLQSNLLNNGQKLTFKKGIIAGPQYADSISKSFGLQTKELSSDNKLQVNRQELLRMVIVVSKQELQKKQKSQLEQTQQNSDSDSDGKQNVSKNIQTENDKLPEKIGEPVQVNGQSEIKQQLEEEEKDDQDDEDENEQDNDEENEQESQASVEKNYPPFIFTIPPGCEEFGNNEHPITIIQMDKSCYVCPKDFNTFLIKTVVPIDQMGKEEYYADLQNRIIKFVRKIELRRNNKSDSHQWQIQYARGYIQERKFQVDTIDENTNQIILCKQDNYDIHMDQKFNFFKNQMYQVYGHLKILNKSNSDADNSNSYLFMTQDEIDGKVVNYGGEPEEEEISEIDQILNQYETLKSSSVVVETKVQQASLDSTEQNSIIDQQTNQD